MKDRFMELYKARNGGCPCLRPHAMFTVDMIRPLKTRSPFVRAVQGWILGVLFLSAAKASPSPVLPLPLIARAAPVVFPLLKHRLRGC